MFEWIIGFVGLCEYVLYPSLFLHYFVYIPCPNLLDIGLFLCGTGCAFFFLGIHHASTTTHLTFQGWGTVQQVVATGGGGGGTPTLTPTISTTIHVYHFHGKI
jgi:hypothetical protein